MTDEEIVDAILMREGNEVAAPDRSGRISRWGITARTLSEHRGHPVTDDEIRHLSATEARDIYKTQYIYKPSFHLIGSETLRGILVDYGVHSGPVTAIKSLQRCLGLPDDGIIGAKTLHGANLQDGSRLGTKVLWERARHLGRLLTADPSQSTYAAGWFNRLADQGQDIA